MCYMYIECHNIFFKNSRRNMKYYLEQKKRKLKPKQRWNSRTRKRREKWRRTWKELTKEREVRAKISQKESLWSLSFHRYLLIYGNHCRKYRLRELGVASIKRYAFINSRLPDITLDSKDDIWWPRNKLIFGQCHVAHFFYNLSLSHSNRI